MFLECSWNMFNMKMYHFFLFSGKLLVKDIALEIRGKFMFDARQYVMNDILPTINTKTISAMEKLCDDWSDIKDNASALAGLQFNNDRALLNRLKAFLFKIENKFK